MRIFLGLLLIPAICGGAGGAQSAASKQAGQPFSITISAPNTQVKAGSPVFVKVRLLNTSGREINERGLAYAHGLDTSYQYNCQNSVTGASHKNDKGLEQGLLTVGEGAHALKPGESHEELAPISEACDLTKPGQYLVQLSRSDPADPSKRTVKSNTIKITVIP
jgi:hypothetical protein